MSCLRIQRRTTLQPSGEERVERFVECPAGRRAVPPEACSRCGYGRGVFEDEEAGGAEVVDCDRAEESAEPRSYETQIHVVPVIALATRDVMCVAKGAPIARTRSMLVKAAIGCLPVVDELGRPIGTISPVDLLSSPDAATAEDAMSTPVVTLHETTSITRAAALMAFEGIHHLPIVDGQGGIVAFLSSLDLLRHLGREHGFLVPNDNRRRRETGD